MNAIVVVDEKWGIGKNGGLLFHLPPDMQFFKETTLGRVVVMGRPTLASFPGGLPLKNRTNIVLSRTPAFAPEGVTVCHSLQELSEALLSYPAEDIFVIGGGNVYKTLLPYCSKAYVTRVESAGEADTFFPNLEQEPGWELQSRAETQEYNGIHFAFCTYRNGMPKEFVLKKCRF